MGEVCVCVCVCVFEISRKSASEEKYTQVKNTFARLCVSLAKHGAMHLWVRERVRMICLLVI